MLYQETIAEILPLTYAAKASGVSLSGSIVMRIGVKSGSVVILSKYKNEREKNTFNMKKINFI